jgi:Tfp pilus assembly protein PilO
MSATETQERRASTKSALLEHLQNPTKLRVFLTAIVLTIGYFAIYQPFEKHFAATKRNLGDTRKRLALAREVEQLRMQFKPIEKHISPQVNSKEWEQYMLGEIRKFPLKLNSFKPNASRSLGPYSAISMQIELSGSYDELDRFLHWLESNERLFRVDDVKISPGPSGSGLSMKITVLGLMG